ncbi:MAG TPA: TIGR01777 family oxidoreductase [Acidimicrobiales bacterium]|nr:TIGR01777 family oxidoreductase [Acidimicrobiales bacterium]
MRFAISGASGLIGSALVESLRGEGHDVLRLVRSPADSAGADAVAWDPAGGTIDAAALEGLDGVVHLAGAGVGDKRWTDARRQEILESRTRGTGLLAQTLAGLEAPPPVFVCGSAIGFYGDRGDQALTEADGPGDGFLANLVVAWEQAAQPAREAGIRTVLARSGIVLTTRGGALPKMLPLFRFGVGGPFGSGKQWMSWITLDDEVAALRFLLSAEAVEGPANLTAPTPVTNRDFAKALGRALHRPALLPIPKFGPKLVLGGQMAEEMLFFSQRLQPAALTEAGFAFAHPDVDSGLAAVLAA